jgi:protein-S-isoprenylcysteine O-methyltransferase Ste14
LIYLEEWLFPSIHIYSRFLTALSWIIFILAGLLIGWSGLWFWRKRTPIEPHHTPKNLIIEGPYQVSRNPIYLALVMLTVGSALGHGSVIGIAIAACLWWVLDKRFATAEETLLLETFGAEAEDYLSKTRRWC